MAHYVYILRSEKTGRYYVGSSADPWQRLAQHNAGKSRSTKPWAPWELVAADAFETASEARRLEMRLKAGRTRASIERFVGKARRKPERPNQGPSR